ncbi:MAG: V-type ATP synthase subunit E [Planctomycetota bacterium]
MSVRNIEEKVVESARAEAEQLVTDARKAADERLDAAKKEQKERAEQAESEAREDLAQGLERSATSARAANKLKLLARKSEILDAVFDDAVGRFIGDRDGAYREWLEAQVAAVAGSAGTLVPAEPDRDAIAELLSDQDDPPELSDESLPLRGGFVVRGERADEDFSLDARLADLKSELLPELAKKAFEGLPAGRSEKQEQEQEQE